MANYREVRYFIWSKILIPYICTRLPPSLEWHPLEKIAEKAKPFNDFLICDKQTLPLTLCRRNSYPPAAMQEVWRNKLATPRILLFEHGGDLAALLQWQYLATFSATRVDTVHLGGLLYRLAVFRLYSP